jgi:hypothetical protein
MKTSKEQQQRMLEMIDHDLKFWSKSLSKDSVTTKRFIAKLRRERRKWRKMEVVAL